MELKKLHNRTFLITGAAQRLGHEIASSLAEQGSNIVIHYRSSEDEAKSFADELRKLNIKAFTIKANLESQEEAKGLIGRAWELAGPIDGLVNSASIFSKSSLLDFSAEELMQNIMVNSFAPLVLARSFVELNKKIKTEKRPVIINMLDTRIADYDREHAAYHISKRMLFTLTRMMALEFAPAVRVNAVAPGLILPPKGLEQSYLEQLKESNPLNDIGNPSQIADAVLFLIENEFITGQVIYVDGGRHLRSSVYGN
jgi:pteridine reductase